MQLFYTYNMINWEGYIDEMVEIEIKAQGYNSCLLFR